MILHDWDLLAYSQARKKMDEVHSQACEDGQNHLILTQHPKVFTVGRNAWDLSWDVNTIQCDRGGSICCHSEGQNIYYFCFHVPSPTRFYTKVVESFYHFFQKHLPAAVFDRKNPGFYVENRKIASLGFRYRNGVSLHGVALNITPDLDYHQKVDPCGLKHIIPTSLENEGVMMDCTKVNREIIEYICESFHESL